jgi:polyketide biosynthesis 3-hydroxy-3-methylglutaryl-CoA synthase-like enzyme PksG
MTTEVGIEALNVYCGLAGIPVPVLFDRRGLDRDRMGNLMMSHRSVGLPFEDPVTNAVNAAKPILEAMDPEERDRIEILVTSSESGVDYSKSIASYVHEYLGLSRNCRLLEVKQACYAATGALQMAVAYVHSGISPGAKVLVIATDVALVDEKAEYSEPTVGFGSAALLIGSDPRVMAIDVGAFGMYSYETMDSARPTPEFDIADVDRSLFAYLDCLSGSFADYASRVADADFATTFDYLAMHTPFSGMVRAGHRRMMRGHGEQAAVEEDFARRVAPSLVFPSAVGNLCSGSVYLALASIICNAAVRGTARVGLFSYGSGCSSEFYSGVIGDRSAAELAGLRITERLRDRVCLTFEEYTEVLRHNLRCLVPQRDRAVGPGPWDAILGRVADRKEMLALTGVTDFHRQYEWR